MLKVTEENIKYLFNLGMGKDYQRNTKTGNKQKNLQIWPYKNCMQP